MPNELNEKLAKWAGFRKEHNFRREVWLRPDDDESEWPIVEFDGEYVTKMPFKAHTRPLPDFCNDLSACFTWLVPKLVQVQITCTHGLDTQAIVYRDPSQEPSFAEVHGYLAPALALCKAIEKVIDA